jgi:sortase A
MAPYWLPVDSRGFVAVRRWAGDDPLLRAGLVMMALALALAGVAIIVTIVVRGGPEPAEAEEVTEPANRTSVEPPVRAESPGEPWVEPRLKLDPREPALQAEPNPEAEAAAAPDKPERTVPKTHRAAGEGAAQTDGGAQETRLAPEPAATPEAGLDPQPAVARPGAGERRAATGQGRYGLPAWAVMSLTVGVMGLHDVPVRSSGSQWALDNGVVHMPETSLPWTRSAQRNVYLAGHRLGWPGTGSRFVFYGLDRLRQGDRVLIRDRQGRRYEYRVTGSFIVEPDETWVMDPVWKRDMLTLQTCTPVPTFDKRLIVRAERV